MAGRPRGKSVKSIAWEKLGVWIIDKGSDRALRIIQEMDDEEYLESYYKLLSYFKPKLTATNVTGNSTININIVSDKETIDKI